MKELWKSSILVMLWQIIGWAIFAFCDEVISNLIPITSMEYNDYDLSKKYIPSGIFLIVTPIIYLIYSKK